jgi:hypothetical protein
MISEENNRKKNIKVCKLKADIRIKPGGNHPIQAKGIEA